MTAPEPLDVDAEFAALTAGVVLDDPTADAGPTSADESYPIRSDPGGVRVDLPTPTRMLFAALTDDLRERLAEGDGPVFDRLNPATYDDDTELDSTLVQSSRDSTIELVLSTIEKTVLTRDEAIAWMKAAADIKAATIARFGASTYSELERLREENPAVAELLYFCGAINQMIVQALED